MKKIAAVFLCLMIILSCSKNAKDGSDKNKSYISESDALQDNSNETEIMNDAQLDQVIANARDISENVKSRKLKKASYSISKDYLKEEVSFKDIDYSKYGDAVGVICTSGVNMYKEFPGVNVTAELEKGDIIEIIDRFENPEVLFEECKGLYEFNKEYNFWYKVKKDNSTGFVFGSYFIDVDNIESSNAKNEPLAGRLITEAYISELIPFGYGGGGGKTIPGIDIAGETVPLEKKKTIMRLSYYYKNSDKIENFSNFIGFENIGEITGQNIINDKFYCREVAKDEYYLSVACPDDMSALYMNLHENRTIPTFISTDYLAHNFHLLFDRMLENSESRVMLPLLNRLCKSFLVELNKLEGESKQENKRYNEAVALLKKYFCVPYEISQYTTAGSGGGYPDVLAPKLMEKYPEINAELILINGAEGFADSPLFGYKEDYSQFKPRSHYTKSEALKKYFKAMMFMGRLNFYCSLDPENKEKSLRLTPAALLAVKILKENENIFSAWKALYNPITYLIGESDDYNVYQYLKVSNDVDFKNFAKWAEDEKNIVKFINNANKKIEQPRISGNSLSKNMQNPDSISSKTAIPAGFKLFGQRFTFDSYIHSMLSSPRVGDNSRPRNMVKSIDVMSVFGNKTANELLESDKKDIANYSLNHEKLVKEFNAFSDEDITATFYNSYLKMISEICRFGDEKPFFFTQSKNWDKRILTSSCASWAELRHDTLLYVKQSFGEMMGKVPGPTWVVDLIKRPIGYVEPNLGALYMLQSMSEDVLSIVPASGIMSKEYIAKYTEYHNIIKSLTAIAEKEAADVNITAEENEFIYQTPYTIAKIIVPSKANVIPEKDLQMALVADVHTDAVNGEVLEAGTGIPYRMCVALNDGNGGKRIAIGYVFSFYEFRQPMSDRLDDDAWKEKVYGDGAVYLGERLPQWVDYIIRSY